MKLENLSSVQQAIFFTQQLYSDSSLFNVGGYAIIEGHVNPTLLKRAIEDVLADADVLIIGNAVLNRPENSFSNYFDISQFATIDFSENTDPDQFCLNWIKNDSDKRHLYNLKLLKAGEHKYYWYAKFHHLTFDGYSMALFFNAVANLYTNWTNDLIDNSTNFLDKFYNYSSFIKEENDYKLTDQYKYDREFWSLRLEKLLRKKALQHEGANWQLKHSLSARRKTITIPRSLYNQIEAFCDLNKVQVFHYFITSLLILNTKLNGDPIVLGIPVFNRRNKHHKKTLGTFVNTLPFSISFDRKITVCNLIRQVCNELKLCYRHLRFPLIDMLKDSEQKGNIYNITFSYQKNVYVSKLGDSISKINYIHNGEQEEDMIFHLLEYSESEDLALSVDYSLSLFSDSEAAHMIGSFSNMLSVLINNSEVSISDIHFLSKDQKHLIKNVAIENLFSSELSDEF